MFSEYLKRKRKKKRQTQVEAAREVGVHVNTWSLWERGCRPDVEKLYRIADWAGVSADRLRPYFDGAA